MADAAAPVADAADQSGGLGLALLNMILGRNNAGNPTSTPQLPNAQTIVPAPENAQTTADAANLANGGKVAQDGTVAPPSPKTAATTPQISASSLTDAILNMGQLLPKIQMAVPTAQKSGTMPDALSKISQLFNPQPGDKPAAQGTPAAGATNIIKLLGALGLGG